MRLLLFDIDGTLLLTNGAGTRAINRTFRSVFGPGQGMSGVRPDGKTDPQILREALERNYNGREMSEQERLEFLKIYERNFRQEIETDSGMQVFHAAYRLLCRLGDEFDIHLGIATGNVEAAAHLKLLHAGLSRFFSFGGYGSDAENRTEMIQAAIRRGNRKAGIEVNTVFVIGDTPNDVLHGKNAGARTLGVATGRYSVAELDQHSPDLAVDSLEPSPALLDFLLG